MAESEDGVKWTGAWARFLIVSSMLIGTELLLKARSEREQLPASSSISSFPLQVGEWSGREIPIDDSIRQVLGAGDFAEHVYSRPAQPPVDLFLAYFPTQRTGSTIHSPKNCLPGSGWSPLESGRMSLTIPSQGTVVVNRYLIARGGDRQLVLYWYQSHGRVIASEYWAKLYLVNDAIHLNRTDGALVRILTPTSSYETVEDAQRRAATFAQQVFPLLNRYIPR
jgi:EpsI family protein